MNRMVAKQVVGVVVVVGLRQRAEREKLAFNQAASAALNNKTEQATEGKGQY